MFVTAFGGVNRTGWRMDHCMSYEPCDHRRKMSGWRVDTLDSEMLRAVKLVCRMMAIAD
jgi:hypothetical protein